MTINLPVLLLKNLVLFPHQEVKLELNNELSKKVVNLATRNHNNEVLVVCPTNQFEENPDVTDLQNVGIVAVVKSKIELPNGNYRVVLHGIKRVKVKFYANYILDNEVLEANCMELVLPKFQLVEEMALKRKLTELVETYINLAKFISNSFISVLKNCEELDTLVDLIVASIPMNINKKVLYMEEINPYHRANALIVDLNVELQVLELDNRIEENLREEFDKTQREYVLKEKIKEIQKELGDEDLKDDVVTEYLELLNDLTISESTHEHILKEIKKYEYTNDASPEAGVVRNYLELVLGLPWNKSSVDESDLQTITNSLNSTHYGLDKIKDRIIEYVAIKGRNKNYNAPIICLVGPPGVGKTSISKGIAEALNKEFFKISVGGLNDSCELTGHRRTYVGANPGKIIQGISKCGVNNPVILIDEIDKMVNDYKGDPSSVLLDILDIEQNQIFIDNYVEEPFDLSKVLFILTANDVSDIPAPLYDRLEIIELNSYTEFEKVKIANEYLLPRIYKEHVIDELTFSKETLLKIIKSYTHEAGVRELDRVLQTIVRKMITNAVITGKKVKKEVKIKDLVLYLEDEKYDLSLNTKYSSSGVVNAMAYTPLGGVVMQIEGTMYDGKGRRIVTGLLGQTMNESIDVAISFIKRNKDLFKVNDYYFEHRDLHLHFLEGAIKKDGPSAGIAIVTMLLSLILDVKVDPSISMTGEINLQGNVLKIGGLKEKVIGAYNSGIRTVFIPKANELDIKELPDEIVSNIKIIPVKKYSEVYKYIFK